MQWRADETAIIVCDMWTSTVPDLVGASWSFPH
jgi:hypothetical protein